MTVRGIRRHGFVRFYAFVRTIYCVCRCSTSLRSFMQKSVVCMCFVHVVVCRGYICAFAVFVLQFSRYLVVVFIGGFLKGSFL